jgi:hypothetical protein
VTTRTRHTQLTLRQCVDLGIHDALEAHAGECAAQQTAREHGVLEGELPRVLPRGCRREAKPAEVTVLQHEHALIVAAERTEAPAREHCEGVDGEDERVGRGVGGGCGCRGKMPRTRGEVVTETRKGGAARERTMRRRRSSGSTQAAPAEGSQEAAPDEGHG